MKRYEYMSKKMRLAFCDENDPSDNLCGEIISCEAQNGWEFVQMTEVSDINSNDPFLLLIFRKEVAK